MTRQDIVLFKKSYSLVRRDFLINNKNVAIVSGGGSGHEFVFKYFS